MNFQEYEDTVRAEVIDLLGCAEADDSLTRIGDSVLHCLVSARFDNFMPVEPAEVAREWAAIVQKTPLSLYDLAPNERFYPGPPVPINRLQAFFHQ